MAANGEPRWAIVLDGEVPMHDSYYWDKGDFSAAAKRCLNLQRRGYHATLIDLQKNDRVAGIKVTKKGKVKPVYG